eukprot:767549-Hanusia_phi.AAC.2
MVRTGRKRQGERVSEGERRGEEGRGNQENRREGKKGEDRGREGRGGEGKDEGLELGAADCLSKGDVGS